MWRWWKDEVSREAIWLGGYRALRWLICSLLFWRAVPASSATAAPGLGRHEASAEVQAADADDLIFADGRSQPPSARRHGAAQRVHRRIRRTTPAWKAGCTSARTRCRSPELLEQGQAKFNTTARRATIETGMGQGIVPAHVPTWQPSNLTEDRIVQMADGEIFNVITNGRRTMPPYGYQSRRWRTAGPSSPTCACCSAPRTAPSTTCRREPRSPR